MCSSDLILGAAFGSLPHGHAEAPHTERRGAPGGEPVAGGEPQGGGGGELRATPAQWMDAARALADQGRFEDAYAHGEIAKARGASDAEPFLHELEQRLGPSVRDTGQALAGELEAGRWRPPPVLSAAALAELNKLHRDILSAPGFQIGRAHV